MDRKGLRAVYVLVARKRFIIVVSLDEATNDIHSLALNTFCCKSQNGRVLLPLQAPSNIKIRLESTSTAASSGQEKFDALCVYVLDES